MQVQHTQSTATSVAAALHLAFDSECNRADVDKVTVAAIAELPAAPRVDALDVELWARTHEGYLRGQLLRYGCPRHEIDEIYAELLLVAWETRESFDSSKCHPLTWMGNVLVRTVIYRHFPPQRETTRAGKQSRDKRKAWRKAASLETVPSNLKGYSDDEEVESFWTGSTTSDEVESSLAVQQFLDALPDLLDDDERALLEAAGPEVIEGLPGAQVPALAERLNMSRHKVMRVATQLQEAVREIAVRYLAGAEAYA